MDTSERIKNIISALNLNNNSFSKKLGIANTTVEGYVKGRKNSNGEIILSQPNYDVIKKMVEIFNINAYYILGLSDDMFSNQQGGTTVNFNSLSEVSVFVAENIEELKNVPVFKNLLDIEALRLVLKAKEGDNINVSELYKLMK
ncbi:helix-turn-helix transcriptional regulator [Aquimarina sp. 2201CG5-10]|uniref:helix-turn-helix transcriptional regulator n=1 Tax=Aquimarina callyspongiae TaxID=3098150 RepID=UPI002AB468B1|nr:helix-turn-helix transcriptional regulator [Aquimarina sp. 2201CG5-10]MDY8137610.1 helix-turn-helix transcriptional regulator [Aquimarina sp. 2201CG5-10]